MNTSLQVIIVLFILFLLLAKIIDYFNQNMFTKTFGKFIILIKPDLFRCLFIVSYENIVIKVFPESFKIWKLKSTIKIGNNEQRVTYYDLGFLTIIIWNKDDIARFKKEKIN